MKSNLLLIKADVLPEIFEKVLRAKSLLACKRVKSASEAAKICGISRSAFYKYKDSVFYYSDKGLGRVINLSAVLEDRPGILSTFIAALCEMNVNILTINQGMPSGGVASVTVSYRNEKDGCEVETVLKRLKEIDGVVTLTQVIGEF